uniref:Uncharacterized protein n=1 Tax=Fagus sylvatica TaxID=28930 RepID=A0A2N9I9D4_FAGSY
MVAKNEWGDRDSHLKADQVGSDIVSPGSLSPQIYGVGTDGDGIGIRAMG